nr:RNA-directed DNA polymerase, eukaryota, reverse transcriptase zinc-binding domain protein [Tanacetum cinerariifolium]
MILEDEKVLQSKVSWDYKQRLFHYDSGCVAANGNDLLIIAVYAPHDLKDKQMLWDYLTHEIGKWKREVVIMGDFNEVQYKSDKFGSVFKVQGANVFNSFIMNAGLEEVPLDTGMEQKNMLSAKNVKVKYKDELEALEAIIDKGDGNVEVVNKRMEVVNTLQKIDKICSSEMAQKAKVIWSIKGDENTSFVHGMLNKKRSLLNIRGIMVDRMRAHIEMRYSKTLTCDQQVELESDMSNEEIKRAVWDCGIDKSPGPDGFTFGFYRRFWNLIQNDVYDAVKYFFTYEVIPKGCNSSFIALILKILDVNTVKDFGPISLIGSLYKIVAKILAKRLVGVLGDIVNEVQSAFIAGSQILDGPFILNEVLQWCKIKTKQSLIFKVDFGKEYDSVRWDFLDDMLKNLDLVKNGVSGFKAALDL